MKKITFSALLLTLSTGLSAQVLDSVSIGGGTSVNEVWYKLSDGTETDSPLNDWDLAFSTNTMSATIRINSGKGSHTGTLRAWIWPDGDNSDWNTTIDVSNIASWQELENDPKSWETGAFNQNIDWTNTMVYGGQTVYLDNGWGVYNMATHAVVGDSIYVLQLANGSYKKIDIINKTSGTVNFRIADLDGSNEVTQAFVGSNYTGKVFGYYSIEDDAFLNPEPASTDWDLVFTKYRDLVSGIMYGVSGILTSPNWEVVEVNGVADPADFEDYSSQSFTTEINTIGSDWKTYTGGQYVVADDLVYFVRNSGGDIWKIIPTGFVGGTEGKFLFTKQQIAFLGLTEEGTQFVEIYPNPAKDQLTIAFDSKANSADIIVRNQMGQVVAAESFNTITGITKQKLDISALANGVYYVEINQNGNATVKNVVKY